MRIDAHQHFWKLNRGDYDWITAEMPKLNRDYLPSDLIPHLQENKIDHTILVQAATTVEETKFMLELSEANDFIAGVVGWLDYGASDYQQVYQTLAQHPKFVGLRINIQDMQDPAVLLSERYLEALHFFADQQIPIDLLMQSDQLPLVVDCVHKVPHLKAVIDHIGKPDIANAERSKWQASMNEIAQHPQIYCKLSGMVTEADHHSWHKDDFIPYIHFIIKTFGAKRVMFGSDWPVCQLAATYNEVIEVLQHAMPASTTQEEIDHIFGLNAKTFYNI